MTFGLAGLSQHLDHLDLGRMLMIGVVLTDFGGMDSGQSPPQG